MTVIFGALGVSPTLRGQPTNVYTLCAGETVLIPAGTWRVSTGLYTFVQEFDPITTTWKNIDPTATDKGYINSDGVNYRVANLTGCVVGANVTTAGTGYTSAPTVTDNSGALVVNSYIPIIGGAISNTVTINNGGKNYTYQPQVIFQAPAAPGVQATGYATISGGAVTAVTVTNQGAGYTFAPVITFTNDPRDGTGLNASATATVTGAGTLTALLVNPGTPISSTTTAPTITFAGGGGASAAATAIMCWTTTAYTITSAGSGFVGNTLIQGYSSPLAASSYTNPVIQSNLVRQRPAIYGAGLSGTGITTAGSTLIDGGIFPNVPTAYVSGFASVSAANIGFTMGTAVDTVVILAV